MVFNPSLFVKVGHAITEGLVSPPTHHLASCACVHGVSLENHVSYSENNVTQVGI